MLSLSQETFHQYPRVRGRYRFNVPLSSKTWFQVGGAASCFYTPADIDDLCFFLKEKPSKLPILYLGAGSNVLARDGGIDACIIRLGKEFAHVAQDGNLIIAGAGCLDRTLSIEAQNRGLANLEFLIGIPGSVGGAVAMNAGAYGGEVKDFLEWIDCITEDGILKRIQKADISMTYRAGNLPQGYAVVRAAFQCVQEKPSLIEKKMNEFLKRREETQPVRGRTGGSTFKNPKHGMKAWELIEGAGCRGLQIGAAQVSPKHCNFLLNLDGARACDLENLANQVQERVLHTYNVSLEWELIRIGKH